MFGVPLTFVSVYSFRTSEAFHVALPSSTRSRNRSSSRADCIISSLVKQDLRERGMEGGDGGWRARRGSMGEVVVVEEVDND